MGVFDEYGNQFDNNEVLNNKQPVNFALTDPTPIQYIDPEFYAHNIAALALLNHSLPYQVNDFPQEIDQKIIKEWCQYHHVSSDDLMKWILPKCTIPTDDKNHDQRQYTHKITDRIG